MARHGLAALGACGASVAAWQFYVASTRPRLQLTPQKTLFYVASTDDQIMDSLRTGDVLLFRRDCFFATPAAAIRCACNQRKEAVARVAASQDVYPFDHCAVVLADHLGTPMVLEVGPDGKAATTPYDRRILSSRASDIVLRRLDGERGDVASAVAAAFLEDPAAAAREAGVSDVEARGGILAEALTKPDAWSSPSAELVAGFLAQAGMVKRDTGASKRRLVSDFTARRVVLREGMRWRDGERVIRSR
jgi:hypothetical protein